jgi:hypothetical protein
MPEAHLAPRRIVLKAYKAGKRGQSKWLHELECGHSETRSRKAPTASVGCTRCLREVKDAAEWSLAELVDTKTTYEFEDGLSGAAWISHCLGISDQMVQPVYSQRAGSEVLTGFSVWVPMDAVRRAT